MTCGEKISGPAEPVPGGGGPPVLALAPEMAARIFPFLEFWGGKSVRRGIEQTGDRFG